MPQKLARLISPTQKSSDFISIPGGTPRPRENPDFLLKTTGPPKIISNEHFRMMIKKMDELGKVDTTDFNSVKEFCQFVDFYNDTVLKSRQNEYQKETTARNEYYWKLWIKTIEASR